MQTIMGSATVMGQGHYQLANERSAQTTQETKREIFAAFLEETLARGLCYWWRPRGFSMTPCICDGERVLVAPADPQRLRVGDVVKFVTPVGFRMHRLIRTAHKADGAWEFIFQGDNSPGPDPPVTPSQIVGVAVAVERHGRIERLDTLWARWAGRFLIVQRALWRTGARWRPRWKWAASVRANCP